MPPGEIAARERSQPTVVKAPLAPHAPALGQHAGQEARPKSPITCRQGLQRLAMLTHDGHRASCEWQCQALGPAVTQR